MVTYRGYNTNIRYASETSFAAGGTIGTALGGKVTSFSPTLNNNLIRTQGLGEGRNATKNLYGSFDASGTIEWEIADFDFLQYGVGALAGSGTTADPYSLAEGDQIQYAVNDFYTFKMEVTSEDATTDDSDVYVGCHLTEWSITATEGETIKASSNWVAKTVSSSTTGTSGYSASTSNPWLFWQATLKYGDTPSAVSKVTSFSLTNNGNSQIYRALGDRTIEKPETGVRTYDFTITLKMSDTVATTFRDDFYGQADSPINDPSGATPITTRQIELDFSEGVASGDRNATIYLEGVNINEISKPVTLTEGVVEITINGYALKAGNSGKLIEWFTTT